MASKQGERRGVSPTCSRRNPRRAYASTLAVLALSLLVAAGGASAARADRLDQELLRQAPAVIKHLQEKEYKNVGVLKFLVRKEKGTDKAVYSDNVGTLNSSLASRLEVALVLANDKDSAKQVGIIRNASGVAAGVKGANHLTPEGRQALFDHKAYPLAWGNQKVAADAFVIGFVDIDSDLGAMTIHIAAFDRNQSGPLGKVKNRIVRIQVPATSNTLVETGESFVRSRGAFEGGEPELTTEAKEKKVVETANKVKDGQTKPPVKDPAAPVVLEVLYDGKPVPFEIKDGRAVVPEPQAGQKVSFVVRKNAPGRFGAVLLVNGENTLFKERLKPEKCHKWIMDDKQPVVPIQGYQIDDRTAAEFVVVSREESKQHEVKYGADVGTITLVVFQDKPADVVAKGKPKLDPLPKAETPPKTDPPAKPDTPAKPKPDGEAKPPTDLPKDEEESVGRGLLPDKGTDTLEELQQKIRREGKKALDTNSRSRGMILEGAGVGSEVQRVPFNPDPTPVMLVTITYYRP